MTPGVWVGGGAPPPNIRARAFVDYWNFKLNWQKHAGGYPPSWVDLQDLLLKKTNDQISLAGAGSAVILETRIYAGLVPGRNDEERRQLEAARNISAGLILQLVKRETTSRVERCDVCKKEFTECRECNKPFKHTPEKGVDALMVTDAIHLAWERAFDMAILVSSDLDFLPLVEVLQSKGFRVIHAGWKDCAVELQERCWGRIDFTRETTIQKATAEQLERDTKGA
jgi:uncharacterized LabA/DUF88 family protein